MTAVLTSEPAAARPAAPVLKVTQARVLVSEFTKFRTVRSTLWTLLVAVVLMIGLSALFAAVDSEGPQHRLISPVFHIRRPLVTSASSSGLIRRSEPR